MASMQSSTLDHLRDTIFAPATPPGRGAIAVVRLSGEGTRALLDQIFLPASKLNRIGSHRACFGRLIRPGSEEVLDEVVAIFYQSPRSYTGQDMAEISIHGSPIIEAQLAEILSQAGARPAQPGEFTFRAVLAGKMDLTQAEAVRDLIDAQTDLQARLARDQLLGGTTSALRPARQELLALIARLEATVEFGEEDALEDPSQPPVLSSLEDIIRQLSRLKATFLSSAVRRSGAMVVIAGIPNAGKSSIFNRLVGTERAIVAEEPGTTRDLISERSEVRGLPVHLYDTAGIRQPANSIESRGIEKCSTAMQGADILLLVIDASVPWEPPDWDLLKDSTGQKTVIALNKSDLPPRKKAEEIQNSFPNCRIVDVSALTGSGMEELSDAIFQILAGPAEKPDQAMMFHHRHESCVHAALLSLEQCRAAIAASLSEEYLLYHLHQAIEQMDRMTGASTSNDLLDTIFSTFCIGK